MARFKVGDIAVGVRPGWCDDKHGMHGEEVTIIKPLRKRTFWPHGQRTVEWGYVVAHSNGHRYRARPDELRPKHEPAKWDDCIWQPKTETVE